MKRLTLRSEHLGELTPQELRAVAGGGGALGTVSDGSCACTTPVGGVLLACDVSDGSCACFCPTGAPCATA